VRTLPAGLASTLLLLLLASGCDDSASVTFPVADEFQIAAADFSLPTALRADTPAGPVVASIPCGVCPSTSTVEVVCVAGVCDPAEQTIAIQVGDVIDFDMLVAGLDEFFLEVRSIEILDVEYNIPSNTMTIPIQEVEVFWAPPGAAAPEPAMGARLLGVVPALAAMETGTGSVALDDAGNAALSEYVHSTGSQIKLFARTATDLAPGGAFPEGSMQVQVKLIVRVVGEVI